MTGQQPGERGGGADRAAAPEARALEADTKAPQPGADPTPAALPPDPEAYDSPRATQARARGLAAPYIAGGEDPHMEATRRRERRYLIALVAMIVVVILSGFVLGVVQNLLGV